APTSLRPRRSGADGARPVRARDGRAGLAPPARRADAGRSQGTTEEGNGGHAPARLDADLAGHAGSAPPAQPAAAPAAEQAREQTRANPAAGRSDESAGSPRDGGVVVVRAAGDQPAGPGRCAAVVVGLPGGIFVRSAQARTPEARLPARLRA